MKCKLCDGLGEIQTYETGIQWVQHCSICDGSGQVTKCVKCNGVGEITLTDAESWRISPCMVCIGNGMVPSKFYRCNLCKGELRVGSADDPMECDCTIKELMTREDGSFSNYYYQIHNMR